MAVSVAVPAARRLSKKPHRKPFVVGRDRVPGDRRHGWFLPPLRLQSQQSLTKV
jgi:hypothetical protein